MPSDKEVLRATIEALADALTEDNTADAAALASPNVGMFERVAYPAIISERTSVILRLRVALGTEVAW